MKKIDIVCGLLAFFIGLTIVFFLSHEPVMNTNDTIKIGMVSLENKNEQVKNLKGLKNIDSNKINKESKEIIEKKEEIQKEDNKNVENKQEKIKEEKEIIEEKSEQKKKPSLSDLKKAISSTKPKLNNPKTESFNPEKESNEDLDRILGEVENGEELVSGNKMGSIGGKILVKWNSNNRKPEFPEVAEYSGKNGKVKIKLKVDSYGNIISYEIEKGSGVPEIDVAIEKVIGTWKMNLLKNKKEIGGTFYINYSFNLK